MADLFGPEHEAEEAELFGRQHALSEFPGYMRLGKLADEPDGETPWGQVARVGATLWVHIASGVLVASPAFHAEQLRESAGADDE